jgi:hypothetical protein
VFNIIHFAAAKWSEASEQSAAAAPAQRHAAADLGACHFIVSGGVSLTVAVGARELHGGALANKSRQAFELSHFF